jgi:hypothetical protein
MAMPTLDASRPNTYLQEQFKLLQIANGTCKFKCAELQRRRTQLLKLHAGMMART